MPLIIIIGLTETTHQHHRSHRNHSSSSSVSSMPLIISIGIIATTHRRRRHRHASSSSADAPDNSAAHRVRAQTPLVVGTRACSSLSLFVPSGAGGRATLAAAAIRAWPARSLARLVLFPAPQQRPYHQHQHHQQLQLLLQQWVRASVVAAPDAVRARRDRAPTATVRLPVVAAAAVAAVPTRPACAWHARTMTTAAGTTTTTTTTPSERQVRGRRCCCRGPARLTCPLPPSLSYPCGTWQLLPTDVRPQHYDLELNVDPVKQAFFGHVAIRVDITKPVAVVTLHAVELNMMDAVILVGAERLRTTPAGVEMDPQSETATLRFDRALSVGEAVLEMSFSGVLNDRLVGFYRSTFERDGKKGVLATTQFEATDARRCFPCWDEPLLKATFRVTLITNADDVTVSNMPVCDTLVGSAANLPDGRKKVVFGVTPVMSTYLLAFVIGPLECISARTADGVLVSCYTTPGISEQGACTSWPRTPHAADACAG